MKNIFQAFQKNMMAATFAEAGEWDTAREMTPAPELSRDLSWVNRGFMAITFAEAGLPEEALRFLDQAHSRTASRHHAIVEDMGLKGVRLIYGTVLI